MLSLPSLQRQHKEIANIVEDLKSKLGKNDFEQEVVHIATQISLLAGKLKIHLSMEDKYMYPYLLKSENAEVRNTAKEYMNDMGHISIAFMDYKEKYNTKSKIVNASKTFAHETQSILKTLEERIEKEETSLYTII